MLQIDTCTLSKSLSVRPQSFLSLSSPVPTKPNKHLLLHLSSVPVKTMTFAKFNAAFFQCSFVSIFNRKVFLCVCRGGPVKLQGCRRELLSETVRRSCSCKEPTAARNQTICQASFTSEVQMFGEPHHPEHISQRMPRL